MAITDVNSLLDQSKCIADCTMEGQRQAIMVLLLADIAGETMASLEDIQAKLSDAGCLECLTSFQLQVIQTQLLLDISSGSSSTGSSCLSCSDSDPVLPPIAGCTCSFHYNRLLASFWAWNSTTASWDKLIG